MKEVCQRVGMTYEALKFYCNKGLVPNVKRDLHNHRVFGDRDIAWIRSLTCLKNGGMSIQEMQQYIELCYQGRDSIPEQKSLLAKKRKELLCRMAELQTSIAYIDRRQGFYDDVLSGKMEYISNLLNENDHTII